MAPTGLVLDMWSDYSDQETIMLDILLPNGIFLKMEASKEATLEELKMEVWVAAQQCPLYGQLHEPESYVFVCVNACTAEREVQVEERRTLSETRPFQAILQLVERKVDNAQKRLNSQIRFLIGKGLREFDTQNPEVSAFRKRMRYFCEISRKNQSQTWQQRLLCQHPAQIESEPGLPRYLLDKLHDENLVLSIHLEHSGSESTFKFSVSPSLDATGLLETILSKKSHSTGLDQNNLCNFLFKVCGLEEYITGTHPLSQYKYIREMISREKVPELLLISMDKVELEEELVYEYLEKLPLGRPRMYSVVLEPALSANRKKQPQLPTWTVEEPFVLSVHFVHRLYCENKSRVALKLCLYHGDERLSKVVHTSDQPIEEGQGSWEEEVKFDLSVSNIPRMARLCLSLYEVSRTVKSNRSRKCLEHKQDVYANPIAWINTTLFDFNGVLKSGPIKLHLWCYGDDIDPDVMLNPLGGAVPNPNYDQCAVLTVSFRKYHQFSDLVYPSLDKILENATILQNENNSSSSSLEPQASKSHLEQLRQICDRDSLYQLHEQEKELLWFLRRQCLAQIPHSLPKLLRSVKWNDRRDIAQMTWFLQTWPCIAPVRALELLDYAFPCPTVRSFAVQCLRDLSDEDLSLYLLQLVRALKHESYFYCDLVQFLLERALAHRHLGHKLFWLLRSEMKFDDVSLRFGLILEAYCRGALKHLPALTKQVEALNKLKVANELVQNEGNKRKDGREKLKSLIQETLSQNSYKNSFVDLQNPLDPRYKLGRLKVEKCKFLDSKMKPLWLTFENSDTFGKDVFIIFKNGDDLRQDMLTLQMIRIMDKMWKDEGLDLRMIPYQCLATDYKVGLIEVVPEADTIANIQKEKGFTPTSAFKKGSILAWLKDHNPDDKSLSKAAEEFTLSCAGYCVATYVLGVADRHSDNIMVKTNGQLFHIDFGHILGKFKEKFGIKRERVPFVLTHDFVYIITKGHTQKSEEFSRFQQYCEQAFTILRRKGPIVVSLFAMMLSTGMPELNCERDLDYLRETLVLDMSEQEALRHFRSKFDDALRSSWKTSVNWMAHNWAKDNKMVD